MRSELLRDIFQSFIESDNDRFFSIAAEIIEDEEKKKHHLLAKDLKKIINSKNQNKFNLNTNISKRYKTNIPIPRDSDKGFPLLEIKEGYFTVDDLILDEKIKGKIENIPKEINYQEIFASYGLKPKQKYLFCGPPGTGKTQTILNLVTNLIYRGLKCAIVSNNNTAIDNIFEKLEEEK